MIYFEDKEIQIRDMAPEDAQTITDEEVAQGWATRRSMRRSWQIPDIWI